MWVFLRYGSKVGGRLTRYFCVGIPLARSRQSCVRRGKRGEDNSAFVCLSTSVERRKAHLRVSPSLKLTGILCLTKLVPSQLSLALSRLLSSPLL